ncbi:MAG: TIGR02266 family protein [Myxococcaceae bacterium]|nr:TIGR02266 family protein [Myxococcaceae bacterium]
MTDQDVELSRQEAAQQQDEANLHAELARMVGTSAEYVRRLTQLKAALADAEAKGVRDPQVSAHVRALAVPTLDGEAPFAQARQLRGQALKARQQATAVVRQQLGQVRAALQQLSQTLATDEQVVQRLVQQAAKPRPAPAPLPADDVGLGATLVSAAPPALKPRGGQPINPAATLAAGPATTPAVPKRQSPRVRMQARVDLESDDNFFNGFSANISDGGVFIATVNMLPLGTSVDVGFTLPTGERIECRGVVRWVREVDDRNPQNSPGMGVQFVDLEPRAVQAIERFIEQREPMFYVE